MPANQDPKKAKEFLSLQENIAKADAEMLRITKESVNATGQVLRNLNLQFQKQEQIKAAAESSMDFAQGFADASADANTYQALIAKNAKDIFKATGKVEDIQKSIANAEADHVLMLKSGKTQLADMLKERIASLKVSQNTLKMQQKSAAGFGIINDMLGDNIDSVTEFMNKLPGGNHLVKLMGIDKLKDKIAEALSKAAMVNATMGGGLKGAAAGAKAFGTSLLTTLGPIALIAAAVGGLVMLFKAVSKQAQEVSKETGLTYTQSKLLVKEANAQVASFGNQLSLQKDILAVQKEQIAQLGVVGKLTGEQAGAVSDIGIAFGYGAEQAGKVNAAFMTMGVTADEAANAQRSLAAEALKSGVNVATVTKDISDNAASTAKFFGGNVEALKKAAIEAAKMGVSLQTMTKVSDNLLDFEKSISAQFELQSLTGKQMNFDLARQLALEGDIAGATAAVMDQVGDIHDFNKMDVLERKKLAEATGMDVSELQKSLVIKDKMGDLTADELASMNALGLTAAEMADMSAEDLQNKLATKQASERTAASFAAMKAQLVNALLPAAEALMSVFAAISPIFKVIGGAIGLILAPITMAFKLMEKFKGVTMVIGSLLAAEFLLRQKNTMAFKRQLVMAKQSVVLDKIKQGFLVTKNLLTGQINVKEALSNTYQSIKNALMNTEIGKLFTKYGLKLKEQVLEKGSYALQVASNVLLAAKNSLMAVGNTIAGTGIGKIMASAGALLMKAVAGIFSSLAAIPFGAGLLLAGGAVAGLFALFNKAKSQKVADGKAPASKGPFTVTDKFGSMAVTTPGDGLMASPNVGGATSTAPSTAIAPPALGVSESSGDTSTRISSESINELVSAINGNTGDTTTQSVSMQDVINAISNIAINLDGRQLSAGIRVADSFRR